MDPISEFLRSATGILGQTFGQMHKNYMEMLDSCSCSYARILMTLLFFKELLQRLSQANFLFEKNGSTSVAFIPFCIHDHFTLKIENANKITLTTKQSFELKEMSTTTLDLGLILGYKGKINEINFVDKFSIAMKNQFAYQPAKTFVLLYSIRKLNT